MSADVSCRVAWAEDAPAIAGVQVRAWRSSYAGVLPEELLASMEPGEVAEAWREAMLAPPDARHRVLVALEHDTVRGFAVTGPSPDPDSDPVADGELTEIVVDPEHRGRGHGSRLLQACVDTLRADRFVRGTTWLAGADDATRAFLETAGWGPDGAHRTLDLTGDGQHQVRQVRLHTALAEA